MATGRESLDDGAPPWLVSEYRGHMTSELNEPIDVVRTYCDAWMAGDAMTVLSLYHDELTLDWPGRHRLAGTYVGEQASIEALLELQTATNRKPIDIVQVLDGPDSVVVIVAERWTAPDDPSRVLEHTRALEYTVEGSQLRTCRVFETAQRAIDDWLGEGPPLSTED